MWRATLRPSLDADHQSVIRNKLKACLTPAGFVNVKTATWEAYSVSPFQPYGGAGFGDGYSRKEWHS